MSMRSRLVTAVVALSFIAIACSGDGSVEVVDGVASSDVQAPAETVTEVVNAGPIVNWRTLGCPEPPPLPIDDSPALAEDAGLAADSYTQSYGVDRAEAIRRLSLQQPIGSAMEQIYASTESARVAGSRLQHTPYFAGVVQLVGKEPVSQATQDILCATPELEVHLGSVTTEGELNRAQQTLGDLFDIFGDDLVGYGRGAGELVFTVIDDATVPLLDAELAGRIDVPYSIESMGLPPIVIDPDNRFPLWKDGGAFGGFGVSGTIIIDEPCAYIGDVLLVFPVRQTVWDPEAQTIDLGTGPMRSGDAIDERLGASDLQASRLDTLLQSPDPSCDTSGGVWLLSS